MEITLDSIIGIISLLVGGGAGGFFTWRWQRSKAKAEAKTAEADAAKELQDVYQQLISAKGEIEQTIRPQNKCDIEPYNGD